jgi:glycolate oxidase iron-sulfur subunit
MRHGGALHRHQPGNLSGSSTVNGCQPVEVPTQVCCGALHAHSGDLTTARQLARRNIDAFERFLRSAAHGRIVHPPAIVINAAGCGALLKEYGDLLHDDPAYAERAAEFSQPRSSM